MAGSTRFFAAAAAAVAGLAALKALSVVDGASGLFGLESAAHAAAPAKDDKKAKKDKKDDHGEANHASTDGHGDDAHGGAATPPEPVTIACPTLPQLGRAGPTAQEIEVLRSLSDRRRTLDAREREIDTQALLLETAESRAADRIDELKALKGEIQTLLGQLDEHQEAEASRLVAMYEKMKAADAAQILPLLDDDVRITVASRMKEASLASILSAMEGPQAAALTMELARRHDAVNGLLGETGADLAE